MRWKLWLPVVLAIIAIVAVVGCEGDQGPAGPPGQDGQDGQDGTQAVETFFGGQGKDCVHCHQNTVTMVRTTNHNNAFDDLGAANQDNPYCLQCHTTGFDAEFAHDGTQISPGTDDYGYDNYLGINTPEASARRMLLEGVQCENCHGAMGPDFNAHRPNVSYSSHEVGGVSTSLCTPCHDAQLTEWMTSGHANAAGGDIVAFQDEHYVGNSSCGPCHTSEGYIWANDAKYADVDFPSEESFIGCPTCHDPHVGTTGGGNQSQLRNVSAVEVAYHPGLEDGDAGIVTMDGYGPAQTCAQCHHSRVKSLTGSGSGSSAMENQINNGYTRFGPHHSPQMETFIGNGSYEIPGYDYDSARASTHNQAITNGCVGCHMRTSTDAGGHTVHDFHPTVADNCTPCHTGAPDFNMNGFQDDTIALMDQVAAALGLGYTTAQELFDAWGAASPHGSISIATQVWQREAAWALYWVLEDGTYGVHNPAYTTALLTNALAHANANNGGAKAGASK